MSILVIKGVKVNCKVLFLFMCFAVSCNDSNGARTFKHMKDVIGSNKKPKKSEFGDNVLNSKKIKSFKKLTSYTMPKCCRWVDENTFEHNKGFTSINIPDGINVIDDYAFSSSHRVKSLSFSNQLVYIGKFAFSDCCLLSCVNIPGSLLPENINITMFDECNMLRNVNIYPVNDVVSERLEEAITLAVAYRYTKPTRQDCSGEARVNEAMRLADAYRIEHTTTDDDVYKSNYKQALKLLKKYKWNTNINIMK